MDGTATGRGRTRARRWLARSGRRGPLGRAAARRLFRAAADGDADARVCVGTVAASPGHRLRDRARPLVARWWAETRDPRLRDAVVDAALVDAVLVDALPFAVGTPQRPLVLALLDRLDLWDPSEARHAVPLLADREAGIRERTAAACRAATGTMLAELWRVHSATGNRALLDLLLDNAAPPPGFALDELWAGWLDDPSGPVGDALLRWRRPATAGRGVRPSLIAVADRPKDLLKPRNREALIDAMLRTGHPLRDIAVRRFDELADPSLTDELCERALAAPEAARFCLDRGIVPADPVKRALFFLLTGRPEQQRALDPDGSLLSLGYAAVSGEVRARLREALPAAGGLDLVRVIVGDDRRARIASMPDGEIRYLADQLAARRAWDDLWAFAKDLPVAEAARAARLFDGWSPRRDDERRLFRMLRAADPGAVQAGVERLRDHDRPALPHAAYLFDCRVNDVSFAPDGPLLAVAGFTKVAGVFDLRTARLVARYDGFASSVGRVLHIGRGAVIAGEENNLGLPECRLVHCTPSKTRTLYTAPASVTSLALTGTDGGFVGATRSGELLLGRSGGRVTVRPVKEFGLGKRQWPRRITAHRASGRLALVGRSLHVLDPASGQEALTAWPGMQTARAAFTDADTLVCAALDGTVLRMPVPGSRNSPAPPRPQARVPGFAGLGFLPRVGHVVVADGEGRLHFYAPAGGPGERATLERVGGQALARSGKPTSLTVSPGGDFVAVGYRTGVIDMFDVRVQEITGVVDRPVADLLPRHLDLAALAADDTAITGDARAAISLLHACLEHRFRFDVEIGQAVRLKAGEHDISL